MKYAACDALVLLRLYDAMSFEVEDLYSKPVDIETLKVDVELPVYVHTLACMRQEHRSEKARARMVGLLPAGTISGENKIKKFEDDSDEVVSGDLQTSKCILQEKLNANFDDNSRDDNGTFSGKRERTVSIGEFRRITATTFNSQYETIWVPHHRKVTKM